MADFKKNKIYCLWFAMCENVATTTRKHPILGKVPICDRCNKKVDEIEKGVRT